MKEVVSKISQKTIDRILSSDSQQIKHGKYVYCAVGNKIYRCNSGSIGCVWTDSKGNKRNGWKLVLKM